MMRKEATSGSSDEADQRACYVGSEDELTHAVGRRIEDSLLQGGMRRIRSGARPIEPSAPHTRSPHREPRPE